MSHSATTRLKVNPPLGLMPALQYLLPAQLSVDPSYQRSLEGGPSQSLVRRIAMFWNWDLCQPLVVARRDDGALFVIDGQHRLEAARLRGDIAQLPAVVVQYASAADEAASFVHLNQQRRPLSKLDVFKAAVASEDPQASAIAAAMASVGLSVAPHLNYISWKPGMVSNIGGIEAAWRSHGAAITTLALKAMAQGFPRDRLQYAGTLFYGIAAVCASEGASMSEDGFGMLLALLKSRPQKEWRGQVMLARAADPNLRFNQAAAKVVLDAWAAWQSRGAAPPPPPEVQHVPAFRPPARAASFDDEGKTFCIQCDKRVTRGWAKACIDRFCKVSVAA